jgi:hypothetical protein
MQSTEIGREFLTRVSEYLVTFPFDLKILQEAIAEPELERGAREIAAGVLISSLSPQEGSGPERFVDDVLVLRIALGRIAKEGGEGAESFRTRFVELYSRLDEDLRIFEQSLGPELWAWLCTRPTTCCRIPLKGKRAGQYIDDDTTWDQLYEDGRDFQTIYDVTESQIHNKLRRPEQLVEIIQRRHAEDLKKRA